MPAAVHDHPAARRGRRRHRLHLAPHRRGHASRRPRHRAARRPSCADRRRWQRSTKTRSSPRWSAASLLEARHGRPRMPAARSCCRCATCRCRSRSATAGGRCCDGVSFDLRAGEILGIGGLLGSAAPKSWRRSSARPTGAAGGEIRIDGEPVDIRSPRDARRLGIALVTEDRKTQGPASAGIDHRQCRAAARSAVWRASASAPSPAKTGWRGDAVEALGIRCSSIEQPAGTLSGGNQQKVVIGKWLATRPRVLLLDEPTRGIDVGAKREIYDLDLRARAREGLAIVVVSSELPELLLLADRILVMSEGRQTGDAAPRRGERGGDHAARRAAREPRRGGAHERRCSCSPAPSSIGG